MNKSKEALKKAEKVRKDFVKNIQDNSSLSNVFIQSVLDTVIHAYNDANKFSENSYDIFTLNNKDNKKLIQYYKSKKCPNCVFETTREAKLFDTLSEFFDVDSYMDRNKMITIVQMVNGIHTI